MGCTASAIRHFLHAPGHRSIDSRSEGSLTSKTHPRHWTDENQLTDVDVRPFLLQHPAMTAIDPM